MFFMEIIFKYFWFLGGIIGVINGLTTRYKINQLTGKNPERYEVEEANKVMKGAFLSHTLPYFAIGILQLMGGFDSFFFIFSKDYNNTYLLLSWLVLAGCMVSLLYWVWIKNGAAIIVKYREALGQNLPNNELLTKGIISLMVLGGVIGFIVGSSFDFNQISSIVNLK